MSCASLLPGETKLRSSAKSKGSSSKTSDPRHDLLAEAFTLDWTDMDYDATPEFYPIQTLHRGRRCEVVVVRQSDFINACGEGRGRLFALKVFRKKDILADPALMRRVVRELKVYRRIFETRSSEGRSFIMPFHGCLVDNSKIYFGMDCMRFNLQDVLEQDYTKREAHIPSWLAQISLGLSALHKRGIIHGRLRPENIYVDFLGIVKISDFSLAIMPKLSPKGSVSKIRTQLLYSAPEIRGEKRVQRSAYTAAFDFWALGVIAFALEAEDLQLTNDQDFGNWYKTHLRFFLSMKGEARALVQGLLHGNPTLRFGLPQLQDLPYFKSLNGETEYQRVMKKVAATRDQSAVQRDLIVEPAFRAHPRSYRPLKNECDKRFMKMCWTNKKGFWDEDKKHDGENLSLYSV